jgi:hypothetical protein
MVLHDQLRGIHMLKDESVTSFLGRYTQIRDELGAVGEVVEPNSLVRQDLNSFTKPWGPFVHDIVTKEVLPTRERMWDDFIQEDIRLALEVSGHRQQQQHQTGQGEEDLALWAKGKNKASRGGRQCPKTGGQPQRSGGAESSSGQGRDMSKVKCFVCKKFGHYAG